MPAQRKPTAVLEASGAFQNHPARRRGSEPDSGRGVGPAPDWLDEDARQEWDEIVADCAAGVWQSGDRKFLGLTAEMLARFRRDPREFGTKSMTLLLGMLARSGMTPSDRSRVIVKRSEPEKPKTGLASFR